MRMLHAVTCLVAAGTSLFSGASLLAAETPAVDPQAIAALEKMGTYLRALPAFQVEATTSDEDVLDDGQKLTYAGVTKLLAYLPGHLRAEVVNDRFERMYLYDGSNFTLFAKRANFYATVPATGKILDLADKLDQNYGLSVPLEDLFRWGASGWTGTADIKAAMKVGPGVIEGVTCEQYVFRQDDIDWQIWIQRGNYPLPRKIVITDRTDEARPQHVAVYKWNLAPSFNDAAFKFEPPEGALPVKLTQAPADDAGAQ